MSNEKIKIGFMIDLSRGRVLKIETLKKMAYCAKKFGYSYINLYMEDLLFLENYPQYGYLRGRYDDEEIVELVKYCNGIDIEIFPAVQTLGHLAHFIRWEASAELADTADVINVVNGKGIKFVEELIKKCRKLFTSNKINIGMDEAFSLGKGHANDAEAPRSQKELFFLHLKNVVNICKENDYTSIRIWSDMLFNVYSNKGPGGLYATEIENDVKGINSDVEIIYWEYMNKNKEHYEKVIDVHYAFSEKVNCALGIHTAKLPFYSEEHFEATKAGIAVARNKGIKDILFTMWDDDGALHNINSSYYGMYIAACEVFDNEIDDKEFEKITELSFASLKLCSNIYKCGINPLLIVWNDPITNIFLKTLTVKEIMKIKENCMNMIRAKPCNDEELIFNLYLSVIINDIDIYINNSISKPQIEKAINDFKLLFVYLENNWMSEAKPHGIEELQIRFSSKIHRYKFLYEHRDTNMVRSIRSEEVIGMNNVIHHYKYIWCATNDQA